MTNDLVLIHVIADSPHGLQLELNDLNAIAQTLGRVVNFEKSKIVVNRNGAHFAKHEKWFIANNNLNVLTEYNIMYLG